MSADGGGRPALGFIGAGKAGSALAVALHRSGYRVVGVSSRDLDDAVALAAQVGAPALQSQAAVAEAAELTFLTVPDTAIAVVAAAIAATGADLRHRAVVHCSARLTASVLGPLETAGAATGVLHPLQALAGAGSAENLRGSSFRVEASGELRGWLDEMVTVVGGYPIPVDEDGLDLYHAAAVLAGNAPLALLARAAAMLETAGIPQAAGRRALAALLEGAAANVRRDPEGDVLTGPVARGDAEAVARHLAALRGDRESHQLYLLLAEEMASMVQAGGSAALRTALREAVERSRPRVA